MYKKNKNKKFNKTKFKKTFLNKKKIFLNKKKINIKKKKFKKKKIQKLKNKIKKNNKNKKYKNLKKKLYSSIKKGKIKKKRNPIITIMGHVNHGKTSLINCIKKLNKQKKINKEIGNITQNINSYNIKTKKGKLTILDTPGHSTFIDIRKKVINISDIIILLISIDDGIMPQTKEIIKYSNKKKKPIIIVLNKIDKINYINNIKKIKNKIKKYKIKYKFIKISTKNKIGINKLIKEIFKISKKIKFTSTIDEMSSGVVLDSSINKNIGPTAKILIKNGILKKGDIFLCKETYGKIKSIYNNNKIIKKAKPSMTVEISGISNTPKLGEKFITNNNKKLSKKIANYLETKKKQKKLKKNRNKSIKDIFKIKDKKTNIIIKTDSLNTIKTIKNYIKKNISKKINIISYKIGNLNKNDIIFAKTTKSIIIIFNINKKNNNNIKKNNKYNIKIYYFNLIYKLIEKLKKIQEYKSKDNIKKTIIGKAIVQNIFKISKLNSIAGCKILFGNINLNNKIKIIRKKNTIYEGYIESIKRFKNKVNIVYKNTECGIQIKNFNNIKIGDNIISII